MENTIKLLTTEQEYKLLNKLTTYNILGSGAGRMVYKVSREDLLECGIEMSDNYDYAVKVAIGLAGINQNHVETETYRNYQDYYSDKSYGLARIYYIGHYIEIMEYVDAFGRVLDECNLFSLDDFIDDVISSGVEVLYEQDYSDAYNLIVSLNDLNGESCDNAQIGYGYFGRLVAYDYGFLSEDSSDYSNSHYDGGNKFCSSLSHRLNNKYRSIYLKGIADLLMNEQLLVDELQNAIGEVEENLINQIIDERNKENLDKVKNNDYTN